MSPFILWLSALYALYYSLLAARASCKKARSAKTKVPSALTFKEYHRPMDAAVLMKEERVEAGAGGGSRMQGPTRNAGRAITTTENTAAEKTMKQYQVEAQLEAAEFIRQISF